MSYYQIELRDTSPELDVSIVIPVKDEEENIRNVADEISEVLSGAGFTWECIWIDDGSTDLTLSLLQDICTGNSNHKYISFDKNYGQSAGFAAGFSYADGETVIMMDGDGQNDPADIPGLIETMRERNCHMVQGYRQNREDNFVRKISSKIANGFRNWMTKDNIRDVGCSLRAIHKESLANLTVFKGMHRFLPTMIRINGFNNIVEIPVNHRPRLKGQTKYGISNRLLVGLKDTFAINWMKTRLVKPAVNKTSPNILKIKENHE